MSGDPEQQVLWRVCARRPFDGRFVTHVKYFLDEQSVEKYVKWIEEPDTGRGEILSVRKYLLEKSK